MRRSLALLLFAALAACSKPRPPAHDRLDYDTAALVGQRSALGYDLTGLDRRPGCRPERDCTPLTWKRVASAPLGLRVLVSLPQQKLWAFKGVTLVATSRVSTGKPGHRTPAGTFRVLEKAVTHHSNKYSNAPMPYMQRLTRSGIALHGGVVPGYPASHGCIRLPGGFAKKLYRMTTFATRVTITRASPRSAKAALALL